MAFSTKSYYFRDTNNSTTTYAKSADHSSYKIYNNMTWSFWAALQPGVNKNIMSHWEDAASNNRSWLFSTQDDGTLRVIFSWDGTNFSLHKTANAVFDFSWKHFIITFASGTFNVYVNNVLQTLNATIAWSGGSVALHSANKQLLLLAKNPNAPGVDQAPGGCMNNFSLWSKVLDSTERTALYNLGRPGDLTAHSAYSTYCTNWYRMDQSDSGTTLVDTKAGASANMTITRTGTNPYFHQSDNYPTYSSDPGIANVRSGTTYVSNGDDKTGTCAVPTAANTKTGVSVDATTGTYDGSDRWTDPGEANVRSGTAYKANSTSNNKTGTCAVPTAANTKTGVSVDATTGTYDGSDRWTDPGIANVRSGTAYKANSTSNNRTGTASIPGASDVKIGVATDATTGTYDGSDRWTDPGVSNVRAGVDYKANSTSLNRTGTAAINLAVDVKHGVEASDGTGTYRGYDLWDAIPASDIRFDETYNQDGEEMTGTLISSEPTTFRGELNQILFEIGAESLSDDEYDALTITNSSPDEDVYLGLLAVLESRESVSGTMDRLRYYFLAKNMAIETPSETLGDDESDIFVGVVLENVTGTTDGKSDIFVGGEL